MCETLDVASADTRCVVVVVCVAWVVVPPCAVDEADLLGDRIGIMVRRRNRVLCLASDHTDPPQPASAPCGFPVSQHEGALRCCGSPMFLKSRCTCARGGVVAILRPSAWLTWSRARRWCGGCRRRWVQPDCCEGGRVQQRCRPGRHSSPRARRHDAQQRGRRDILPTPAPCVAAAVWHVPACVRQRRAPCVRQRRAQD